VLLGLGVALLGRVGRLPIGRLRRLRRVLLWRWGLLIRLLRRLRVLRLRRSRRLLVRLLIRLHRILGLRPAWLLGLRILLLELAGVIRAATKPAPSGLGYQAVDLRLDEGGMANVRKRLLPRG